MNDQQNSCSRLLKADEVARILNISRSLTYRLFQEGKIPTIKINKTIRVKPNDLNIYIQNCHEDF
ncbi:MAG TPA: helix-turn-helix domain-containing protein [Anaerolineae bacterium]|nr:helix-turn-helix domain-containing protein [Anaerolineae bacterium]